MRDPFPFTWGGSNSGVLFSAMPPVSCQPGVYQIRGSAAPRRKTIPPCIASHPTCISFGSRQKPLLAPTGERMWLFDLLDANESKRCFSPRSVCNEILSTVEQNDNWKLIFEFAKQLLLCCIDAPCFLRRDQHCPRGGGSPHVGQERRQRFFS